MPGEWLDRYNKRREWCKSVTTRSEAREKCECSNWSSWWLSCHLTYCGSCVASHGLLLLLSRSESKTMEPAPRWLESAGTAFGLFRLPFRQMLNGDRTKHATKRKRRNSCDPATLTPVCLEIGKRVLGRAAAPQWLARRCCKCSTRGGRLHDFKVITLRLLVRAKHRFGAGVM